MTTYRIIFEDVTRKKNTMSVRAYSKKQAYALFRKTIHGRCSVIAITEVKNKKRPNSCFMLNLLGFIGILLILTVCVVAVIQTFNMPEPVDYDRYVVQHGDTLWDIAKESNAWGKIDGQQIISDMREYSNCSANIRPGQIVYIPQY